MIRERVVVLSSMIPTFSHLGSIVLGTLVEAIAMAGADVRFAHTGGGALLKADPDAERRLARVGARPVEGAAPVIDDETLPKSTAGRVARYVRETIDPRIDGDSPRFRDPAAEVERLVHPVPAPRCCSGTPITSAWCRRQPRRDARLRLSRAPADGGLAGACAREAAGLKRGSDRGAVAGQGAAPLGAAQPAAARNICALDASWYDDHGVGCRYLPNTWPDALATLGSSLRRAAEGRRQASISSATSAC